MNDIPANSELRQEIIESQKTQAEFLKWKLITIAAVASVALGLEAGKTTDPLKILFCLIPLLCGYVDLISLHIMIRVMTIGIYLRMAGDPYETFVFRVREKSWANPFIFEASALHGSSLIFNLLIIFASILIDFKKIPWPDWCANAFLASGILGIIWTVVLCFAYLLRVKEIKDIDRDLTAKASSP
jgi:hypothetical protein